MSAKMGLLLGAMLGLVAGAVGCLLTFGYATEGLQQAKAQAYDEGRNDGAMQARAEAGSISGTLNDGLLREAGDLGNRLDAAREKLEPLAQRPDLPKDVRDTLAAVTQSLRR
ncbi:MAG: hypothetical protein IT463_01920 [Planctomycetes bacterium]|nr:hypothetical protein [Planctomycetota bacterium]